MKVLVCEDEVYARQSLIKQIKKLPMGEKFDIIEARNGEEGFELFKKDFPEIVLLDIKMPLLDGISLLKLIIELAPDTKVVMVSGYAYFNFSQEALNCGAIGYLLKPVNDGDLSKIFDKILEEKNTAQKNSEELSILKNNDMLSQMIYNAVILNNISQESESTRVFDETFADYRVVALFFQGNYHQNAVEVVRIIQSAFEEQTLTPFKEVLISKHMLSIVTKETTQIDAVLNKLCHLLNEASHSCYAGVSGKFSDHLKLSTAYQQALTAVKSRLFFKKQMVFYDDLEMENANKAIYHESDFSLFRLFLEKGDKDGAIQFAMQLACEMKPYNKLSVVLLENTLVKLSSIFVELVQKNGLDEIQTELLSFDLLLYSDFDVLQSEIEKRIKLICAYIQPHSTTKNDNIMSIVTNYINENYNKEISLKHLAQKVVFLNHTYLSHLIHEKTGKSYSIFLREIRIKKAKELLLTSELSITEIATMCGYNDTSQFIRIFKKDVGVTPKMIRNNKKSDA